jgi:predicted Zn-dependent protease
MRITYLFTLCLVFALPASANIGDRPVDWSKLESADFRDYAIRHFNRQGAIVNNYWLHFWLNQKLLELNFNNPSPVSKTVPLILKNESINAFAIPGNIIGIHSGLWLTADSEAEFLSVLAHEMAHISLDHFSRLSDNSQNQTWAIAGGILLTLLFSQDNPELANAALLSTIASTQQNQLNFSRSMELEADQLAQKILNNSDYDPEAGRLFFQKLEERSNTTKTYEFLRTHPRGSTRSTNLSSAASSESTPANDSIFNVLKAQLAKTNEPVTIKKAATFFDANEQFAVALIAYQKNEIKEYELALQTLTLKHPQFLPAHAKLLELLKENKDPKLCAAFNKTSKLFENEFLTLDVLEVMKSAAEQCRHNSAEFWHSQLLWYSGKEEQALAYLTQSLRMEPNENKAARIKTLLSTLSERYDRFR